MLALSIAIHSIITSVAIVIETIHQTNLQETSWTTTGVGVELGVDG